MRVFRCCLPILLMLMGLAGCDRPGPDSRKLERFIHSNTRQVVKFTNPGQLSTDLDRNELAATLSEKLPYRFLNDQEALLAQIRPDSFAYLFAAPKSERRTGFNLIFRPLIDSLTTDSLEGYSISPLDRNGVRLQRLISGADTLYRTKRDSTWLYASSAGTAERLYHQVEHDSSFAPGLLALQSRKNLAIYDRDPVIALSDSVVFSLADSRLLELSITASQFSIQGLARAGDSTQGFVRLFRGQEPRESRLIDVLPATAREARSFVYQDAGLLVARLQELRADSLEASYPLLLETIQELGQVELVEGHAVVAYSLDPALTQEQLEAYWAAESNFRDVSIYSMQDPKLFGRWLSPLISTKQARLAFRLGDHFVFASGMEVAQSIITAYQNNAVLAKSPLIDDIGPDILEHVSAQFLHLGDQVSRGLQQALGFPLQKIAGQKTGDYKLGVFQLSTEKDFMHLNFVSRESTGSRRLSPALSQLTTINLETPVMSRVQLFSNHRTGGKDIVFQDLNNDLCLYSSSGKRLWKRRMDGPVLGEIHEVDILRNGKKQLAFTTSNELHVIDRNGNTVAPFPVKFNDPITQPLSVFDYDSNRNYRFAIVQGSEIRLYDSRAKVVSGFRFRNAGAPIVLPARHIRIGRKDYVIIAEEDGKLNILSRVGRSRVPVNKRFEFSDNPVTREGDGFVVITKDKTKVTISTSGKLSSRPIEVGSDFFFRVLGRVKVTLDENILRINGRPIELPFGLYSEPRLYKLGSQMLVGITETQEKKVYLYNSQGELLPGLPAYGADSPDLGRSRSDGTLMLVEGSDTQILLYRIKD